MHLSTILTLSVCRFTRSFARPLFVLCLLLSLLPAPLVQAQTSAVPQAAAQAQPEAQARELERRLNFPRGTDLKGLH